MKHERVRPLAAAISLILIAVSAPTHAARQSQPRAGDAYDERAFIIEYGNAQQSEMEKAEEIKAQARELVWESWRQKRPAHCVISATYLYVKDRIDRSHFYIRQDAGGRWEVFVKFERNYSLDSPAAGKEAEMRTVLEKTFRTVQRRETVPMEGRRLIADDEKPKPRTYELWFTDPDGENGGTKGIAVL